MVSKAMLHLAQVKHETFGRLVNTYKSSLPKTNNVWQCLPSRSQKEQALTTIGSHLFLLCLRRHESSLYQRWYSISHYISRRPRRWVECPMFVVRHSPTHESHTVPESPLLCLLRFFGCP